MALTSVDAYRETVLSGRATSQLRRVVAFVRTGTAGFPVSRANIALAFKMNVAMGRHSDAVTWLDVDSTWDGGPPIPLGSVCRCVYVGVKSGLLRELDNMYGTGPHGDKVKLVVAVTPAPVQRNFDDFGANFSGGG